MTLDGDEFEAFIEKLSEIVRQEDENLGAVAHWGFEFYFRGKPLRRLQTLKKCKKAFEFEVRKKPEPIVEKVEEAEDGEGGEGEEGEEGAGDQDE